MAASEVQWEIETDGGWELFRPGVPFQGAPGEQLRFDRGSFHYKVAFTKPSEGFQENLRTGRTRRLRHAAAASSAQAPPRRGGSDLEHAENLQMLRRQLLATYPQVANEEHHAHALLKRAQAAEDKRLWELAFNEIFAAQESLANTDGGNIRASASTAAALKRTASRMLGEATGEPRRVARRLLNESEGDEAEAFERALLIHDLELGSNHFIRQVELNKEALECQICTEQVESREAVRLQPCQHGWYCVTCIQRTVNAKISDGATVGTIRCPECHRALSEALLRALLSKDQMQRLHRQSLESAVSSCPGLRPCPTPDCPNRVVLEDGVQPCLRCELCHKEHCLLCSASPFHVGKTCEQHLGDSKGSDDEKALRKWMADVGAKQCPKCQAVVTKYNLKNQATQASECHKMICRACRTRFCFHCLTELTDVQTCGCTANDHGFIDPDTGAFVRHLGPSSRVQRRRAS